MGSIKTFLRAEFINRLDEIPLVLSETQTQLEFQEIASNSRILLEDADSLIEWSVNDETDEIILLLKGESEVYVKTVSIEELIVVND